MGFNGSGCGPFSDCGFVFRIGLTLLAGGGEAVAVKDMRLLRGMLVAWMAPKADFLVDLVELTTVRRVIADRCANVRAVLAIDIIVELDMSVLGVVRIECKDFLVELLFLVSTDRSTLTAQNE